MSNKRVYLSPPHMCGREMKYVKEAFASNWIAPLGPMVDAFEREFAQLVGVPHTCALSSGTAALHLALRIVLQRQVKEKVKVQVQMKNHPSTSTLTSTSTYSDKIICPTLTFSASANVIVYEGCAPVFIDCDERTWTIDPDLLSEELDECAKKGKLPRAVITVDLYGQCCDYELILAKCAEYEVPVIEDAAEALGATYQGRLKTGDRRPETEDRGRKVKVEEKVKEKEKGKGDSSGSPSTSTLTSTCSDVEMGFSQPQPEPQPVRYAGSFGVAGAFSFNGNKVITTAGGGMLVSHHKEIVDKARFLATQARDPAPYYQHSEIGFNYRMSNILAAIGRGQLTVLNERVAARRRNFEFYQQALGDLPGIGFMPEAPYGKSSRWLTCITIDPKEFGATSEEVRLALEKENIEARPLWKPLHLQPVFKDCRVRGGRVAERLFGTGLCLPSGSNLTEDDLNRVCEVIRKTGRG